MPSDRPAVEGSLGSGPRPRHLLARKVSSLFFACRHATSHGTWSVWPLLGAEAMAICRAKMLPTETVCQAGAHGAVENLWARAVGNHWSQHGRLVPPPGSISQCQSAVAVVLSMEHDVFMLRCLCPAEPGVQGQQIGLGVLAAAAVREPRPDRALSRSRGG